MAKPFEPQDWDTLKERVIGLGERSFRKSYYPQLRENIDRLERFRTLLDRTTDFVVLVALPEAIVADANAAFGKLIGEHVETLIGRSFASLGLGQAEEALEKLLKGMSAEAPGDEISSHPVTVEYGQGDAHVWLELSCRTARLDGRFYGVMVGRDITDRMKTEAALRESEAQFRSIAASAHDAIIMMNQAGLITFWNPAAETIFGYAESEAVGGNFVHLLFPDNLQKVFEAGFASFRINGDSVPVESKLELKMRCKCGREIYVEMSTSFVKQNGEWIAIGIARDVTAHKVQQTELERVANYDALTGLPNRRLLLERIEQGVVRSQRSGNVMAVCQVDLDNFKSVNDRYGHENGDQVLMLMAARLEAVLRSGDTLAHFGGDEFVILFTDLANDKEIDFLLDCVLNVANTPIKTQGFSVTLSASIGVARFPDDDGNPDTLLRYADQAMYMAKRSGKNGYRFFDQQYEQKTQAHIYYQQRLREALRNEELVAYYQPKVDMLNGEVIGVEALIRWQHPEKGLLSLGDFMQYIDGTDLEVAIGDWAINAVLAQKAAWDAAGLPLSFSVNISAGHFLSADFAERLSSALARYPSVEAQHLELEILETAALSDLKHAELVIRYCRELGVKIAIDDFGTGYSSLTYLRNLPFDILKVDRSFVCDMLTDPADHAIVVSVVQLAKKFDRMVIAEGVESLEHCAKLASIGCQYMQGYGIAHPMPPEQMSDWFEQWHQKAVWRTLSSAQTESAGI